MGFTGCHIDNFNNRYHFINGQLHRDDGPAFECHNGSQKWFLNGVLIRCETQEEFEHFMKLKAFW